MLTRFWYWLSEGGGAIIACLLGMGACIYFAVSEGNKSTKLEAENKTLRAKVDWYEKKTDVPKQLIQQFLDKNDLLLIGREDIEKYLPEEDYYEPKEDPRR